MSKRPRADTSAESSQPSARIRYDDSDIDFNVFDAGDIEDLVKDVFDGQLSDLTDSDGDSDVLSLSDTEDADAESIPTDIASGDWRGTRTASHNYRFPDDPKGPVREESTLVPIRLSKKQKKFIEGFCKDLVLRWPVSQLSEDRYLVLADPTAFWHALLRPKLQEYIGYLLNLKPENRGNKADIGNELFDLLVEEIASKQPFFSGLLLSVYRSCIGHLGKEGASDEIKKTLSLSSEVGKQIIAAKRAGCKFANEAIWIPVRRRIENPTLQQHMVETTTLRKAGQNSGAIKNDWVMVGVPQGYRLIAAPPATSSLSHALIFWEPKNAKDRKPAFDKVIGACIHGADKRNPVLGDPHSEHIRLQCAASANSLQTKLPARRNVKEGGLMTKDIGRQSTYGAPYSLLPKVEASTSVNPLPKTIKRIQEQSQLRIDIKKYTPAIQSIDFALLQGFLPIFATQQYTKALEKNLINVLGRPDTSCFATYAYCAGLHLDRDETATHGWVIDRGKEVHRRESNFVWGNHQVILQLSKGTHWFWRAHIDAHGTTANRVAMQHPGKWKTPRFLERKDHVQWTRANTIPKAVGDAVVRSQK